MELAGTEMLHQQIAILILHAALGWPVGGSGLALRVDWVEWRHVGGVLLVQLLLWALAEHRHVVSCGNIRLATSISVVESIDSIQIFG